MSLLARLGGHSAPRTHRGKERFPGMTITYVTGRKGESTDVGRAMSWTSFKTHFSTHLARVMQNSRPFRSRETRSALPLVLGPDPDGGEDL